MASTSGASSRKRKAPPRPPHPSFSNEILDAYETHVQRLKTVHEMRREATTLKNVATDVDVVEAVDVWDTLGKKQPTDKFNGCVNLRTLRSLLKLIDDRGFERYQCDSLSVCSTMRFSQGFVSRILCLDRNTKCNFTRRLSDACRASSTRESGEKTEPQSWLTIIGTAARRK